MAGYMALRPILTRKKTEAKDSYASQRGLGGGLAGCGLVAAETRGGMVFRSVQDLISYNHKECYRLCQFKGSDFKGARSIPKAFICEARVVGLSPKRLAILLAPDSQPRTRRSCSVSGRSCGQRAPVRINRSNRFGWGGLGGRTDVPKYDTV